MRMTTRTKRWSTSTGTCTTNIISTRTRRAIRQASRTRIATGTIRWRTATRTTPTFITVMGTDDGPECGVVGIHPRLSQHNGFQTCPRQQGWSQQMRLKLRSLLLVQNARK